MVELPGGVWWWEALHPEWGDQDAAEEGWGPDVSSYAVDDGKRLLLLDPTTPPAEVSALAAKRETVILLTCPWHERDTRALAERFGAQIFAPPPDGDDLRAAHVFEAGDSLPFGVRALPGMEPNDLVLWIESPGALVTGDTLIDRGGGLVFPRDWANKGVPADTILETLQPLLELPVEIVLPTHGAPTDRAALECALSWRR